MPWHGWWCSLCLPGLDIVISCTAYSNVAEDLLQVRLLGLWKFNEIINIPTDTRTVGTDKLESCFSEGGVKYIEIGSPRRKSRSSSRSSSSRNSQLQVTRCIQLERVRSPSTHCQTTAREASVDNGCRASLGKPRRKEKRNSFSVVNHKSALWEGTNWFPCLLYFQLHLSRADRGRLGRRLLSLSRERKGGDRTSWIVVWKENVLKAGRV